jgi:predicted ATPase
MITRIEIDGFKSLRGFAVDLEPLTVFIGPNNAGKSNILEALALLSRLASQPIDEAFKQGRGDAITQFARSGGEAGRTIRFAVELLLPRTFDDAGAALPNRCRYELVIERRSRPSGAEYLAVQHESLWALDRANDTWIDAHADMTRYVHSATAKHVLLEQVGEDERERRVSFPFVPGAATELPIPQGRTSLEALRDDHFYSPLSLHVSEELANTVAALAKFIEQPGGKEQILDTLANKFQTMMEERKLQTVMGALSAKPEALDIREMTTDVLAGFHLLHLAPAALRASSERIGVDTLAPDGSNLPIVLANLPAPLVGEIRADIVSVVPGIASFEVVPEGDELRIEFILSGGERMPAELTSDGTLRILALLTAMRVQPRPSVIGVDELENGIYPGRLRQLLGLLKETVALGGESDTESANQLPIQLLMTTHSPVMLDAFRSQLQSLRFVDLVRRDRQLMTRARPVHTQAGPDRGHLTVSLREVDELLQSADSEIASSM